MLKSISLKKIVVKIGTKVLAKKGDGLDQGRMAHLVSQVSGIIKAGRKVVLVSSGAIGSGMALLGFKTRPKDLSWLQACASVGQPHLMQAYDTLFNSYGLLTAQVLLTQEDLNDRRRYLNAKNTLLALIEKGVVPIVNENDTVSTDEIKFGDNDRLSSLVANLIGADLLILLSDVDGLYKCEGGKKELIPVVNKISAEIESLAQKAKDELGTGGMISKLQAARMATSAGISCIIANGKKDGVLTDIVEYRAKGTLFVPSSDRLAARECWILFGAKTKGRIQVDNGAKEAVIKRNKSLLSSGVVGVEGEFKKGDAVSIVDREGREFAKGIVNYPPQDIDKIKGLKTAEISKVLGYKCADEIVHKDNLVVLIK